MKRLFDLALLTPAMILILPVISVIGCLIRFTMGKPVLFRQQRPGFKGKPFTIYKFRTMSGARDKN
ncbi:MAG: sugar transferase, partial [Deltaproteobacteria bacterium]|nr:sugar transferase [Deltaproteobacteria bacterium]